MVARSKPLPPDERPRSLLLKIPDALTELGVSRSQLYLLLKAGEIKSVPVGKRGKRIPYSECVAYVNRHLAEPADEAPDAGEAEPPEASVA